MVDHIVIGCGRSVSLEGSGVGVECHQPFQRNLRQMMTIHDGIRVDFAFVADTKIRRTLEQFHREAVNAYEVRAYVATVVLTGAVMEGVLTYALTTKESEAKAVFRDLFTKKVDRPPAEWNLNELIQVAGKMGLIGDIAKQGAWAIKDFRNLIHPYRLLTMSPPRWQALALSAIAGVASVSASIAGRLGAPGNDQA